MDQQLKRQESNVGLVFRVLAIILVVVLVQCGQVFLTGSSPQPLVWVLGTVAVLFVSFRHVRRNR